MHRVKGLLEKCVELGGSDLHFKTDTGAVYIRINGELLCLEDEAKFTDEDFRKEIGEILRPSQLKKFDKDLELDFSLEIEGVSRFRGNAYQQRGHMQAAFRVIPYHIQSMEDIGLPLACYDFVQRPRGLVLVTGPAGSGKSTSLAAMINKINKNDPLHIMTVEDPVEFVHDDAVAIVNQRELDVDTLSFANALKYVLRQDPDVILVGEMRDLETIHLAITAAETGHLVFATLHTVDSVQTVDRIVDVFPVYQQQQIRMQLSVNLIGVLSQTLVMRKDGRGRVPAFEVLVANGAVRNHIRENKTYQISSILQTGLKSKMNTLDQYLSKLVEKDIVTFEAARAKAKDPSEFDRLVELATGTSILKLREGLQDGKKGAAISFTSPPQADPNVTPPPIEPATQAEPTASPEPPPAVNGQVEPKPAAPQQGGVRGQPNRPGFRRE